MGISHEDHRFTDFRGFNGYWGLGQHAGVLICSFAAGQILQCLNVPERKFPMTGCPASFLSLQQRRQSLSDLGRGARRILFSIILNGARTSAVSKPLKIFDSWNRCESETCLFEYVGLPFSGKCYWKRAQ